MRVLFYIFICLLLTSLTILGTQAQCTSSSEPFPLLIGMITPAPNETGVSQSLTLYGQTAFLTATTQTPLGILRSIDVSDPTHPQVIQTTELMGQNPTGSVINGNHLYVMSQPDDRTQNHLEIFDISSPDSLQQVGSLTLNDLSSTKAVGIKENALLFYSHRSRSIEVIDISNLASPKYVRSVFIDRLVNTMHIHNNLAFLANSSQGLSVLDIENPLDPIFLSSFAVAEDHIVNDATAQGKYAYFIEAPSPADRFNQFTVVDASNPAEMEFVSTLLIGEPNDGVVENIALEGTLVAISVGQSPSGFIQLIDISDPAFPQKKGSAEVPYELKQPQGGIIMRDGLIFLSAFKGLGIYQVVYE